MARPAMLRIAVMGLSRTRPRSAVLPPLGGTHRQTTSDHPIARKLAILAYRAFKGELVYRDLGADAYDRLHRTRTLRRLRQRAATLGF
jgi:transposase